MKNLINVFIKPKKFFNEVKESEKLNFIYPLIIIFLIQFLYTFLGMRTILRNQFINPYLISLINSLLSVLKVFLIATIFYLILYILGYKINTKKIYPLVFYTYLPNSLRDLIRAIFGIHGTSPGLASLLNQNSLPFLYNILSKFDIFSIWSFILLIIGIKNIFEVSKKKISIALTIYFLVVLILPIFIQYEFFGRTLLSENQNPNLRGYQSGINSFFRIFRFFGGGTTQRPPTGNIPPTIRPNP
ncbi:MAG: Yip1 family protein [Caldisericia bacterium]